MRAAVALAGLLMSTGLCLHAGEPASEGKTWLAGHELVRAGFGARHPPFVVVDAEGVPVGIDVAIFKRLTEGRGLKVSQPGGSIGLAAMDGLLRGEIDLVVGVDRSPELLEIALLTEPYLSVPAAIVAREDAASFVMPGGLGGKTIAVVSGAEIGLSAAQVKICVYGTMDACLGAVAKGAADAAVVHPIEASYVIQSRKLTGLKFVGTLDERYESRIAVRKDWPELVALFDQAIAAFPAEEKNSICSAWIPARRPALLNTSVAWVVVSMALCLGGGFGLFSLRRGGRRAQIRADQSRLRRDLARTNELASSLTREKKRLLELAVHDIVHPVTDIGAHAARLDDENLPDADLRAAGGAIAVQARRLQAALDTLHAVRALETGSNVVNLTTVNVGAVLHETIVALEAAAAKRQVCLSAPALGNTALAIADVDVLRKIIESLLVGALKLAPPKSAISIALWPTTDRVVVSVSDEGPGVAVADEARVFGSYRQLGEPLVAAEGVAGYGLALVQSLIKATQGWFWYESTPGVGTTYVIELPIASA